MVAASSSIKFVIQNVARLFAEPAVEPEIPILASYKSPVDIAVLPTGFRPLDKALGINGLPVGKITELVGPGSSLVSGGAQSISFVIIKWCDGCNRAWTLSRSIGIFAIG